MQIYETTLTEEVLARLIELSVDWTNENSCYGYRPNDKSDIDGKSIFVAEDAGVIIAYLFGQMVQPEKPTAAMPEGTPYFEINELYVIPERRSQGIGGKLFRFAEETMKPEADYLVLSTATKNWKAILHFYLEEMDMTFWSARLFKKIDK